MDDHGGLDVHGSMAIIIIWENLGAMLSCHQMVRILKREDRDIINLEGFDGALCFFPLIARNIELVMLCSE